MIRFAHKLFLSIVGVFLSTCLFFALLGSTFEQNQSVSDRAIFSQIRSVVSFPLHIADTTLVVEHFSSYDGAFYEDGSGREVFNVAAIRLHNSGDQMVASSEIVLHTENGKYIFEAMMIPPYASVLVPEKNAAVLQDDVVVDYCGVCNISNPIYSGSISVHCVDKSKLCIKNIAETPVCNLKIYHKTYLPDADMYIGGIAFVTEITCILPNDSIQICPNHFAQPYSKIILIQ